MVKTMRTGGLDVYSNNLINKSTLAKAKPEAYKHIAKYGLGKHKQAVPVKLPSGKVIMRTMDVGQREKAPKNLYIQKPDEQARKDIIREAEKKRLNAQRVQDILNWDKSPLHEVMEYLDANKYNISPTRSEIESGQRGGLSSMRISSNDPKLKTHLEQDYYGKIKLRDKNYTVLGTYSRTENAAKKFEEEIGYEAARQNREKEVIKDMNTVASLMGDALDREVKIQEEYPRDYRGKMMGYKTTHLSIQIKENRVGINVSGDNKQLFTIRGANLPTMSLEKLKNVIDLIES